MFTCRILRNNTFLLLFISILCFNFVRPSELYSENDEVIILDNSTFADYVHDSKYVWFVEFFSSWCGHCQMFAPTWKKFADEVKAWNKIVKVAGVDCAREINTNICRHYDISVFPTFKFFTPKTPTSSLGSPANFTGGKRDVDNLRAAVISVLDSYSSNYGKPSEWPDFNPITDATEEIKMISRGVKKYFLIIENRNSTVGRETQMDAISASSYYVRRKINDAYDEAKLYLLSSSRAPDTFLKQSNSHSLLTSLMMKMSGSEEGRDPSKEEIEKAQNQLKTPQRSDEVVHSADIFQGLRYSFYNEIGLKKLIKDENLIALKNFIHQLYLHLDIDNDLTLALSQLDDWLESKLNENLISHNEWRDKIRTLFYNVLPPVHEYVGCYGSKPHLRGYPCSLWTIFHILTVHSSYMSKPAKRDPPKVLMAMRGYVKYFFGCSECTKNFLKMAANVTEEARGNREALWLWRSHNKVNKRLKGTSSEDPTHIKQQFPSRLLCWDCQKRSNQFRVANVVEYLKKRYSRAHIVMDHTKRKLFIQNSKSVLFLSQFDVGFCIAFYIASVILIICVYLYLWRKKTFCRKYISGGKYFTLS